MVHRHGMILFLILAIGAAKRLSPNDGGEQPEPADINSKLRRILPFWQAKAIKGLPTSCVQLETLQPTSDQLVEIFAYAVGQELQVLIRDQKAALDRRATAGLSLARLATAQKDKATTEADLRDHRQKCLSSSMAVTDKVLMRSISLYIDDNEIDRLVQFIPAVPQTTDERVLKAHRKRRLDVVDAWVRHIAKEFAQSADFMQNDEKSVGVENELYEIPSSTAGDDGEDQKFVPLTPLAEAVVVNRALAVLAPKLRDIRVQQTAHIYSGKGAEATVLAVKLLALKFTEKALQARRGRLPSVIQTFGEK